MDTLERELLLTAPAVRRKTARRTATLKGLRRKDAALGYLFLAPSILLFAVFLFYPTLKSVYLSFHLTDPRGRIAAFAGFDNYSQLFASASFWNSLKVTGLFTLLTVPAGLALGLLTAALTHAKLRGMRVFQFIFALPLAVSASTAAVIWMMLLHPSVGIVNYALGLIGIAPVQWLSDPAWALLSIAMMSVWMQSGFHYIILLSGLQGIPDEMYESAKIDGAGPLRTFIRIILPLLSPTVFFLVIVSVINAFQTFGQIHILTKGGPAGSTDVLVYSIYKEAFVNYQFGTGSAMALVLFLVILVLTLIQFTVLEKKVHYQ